MADRAVCHGASMKPLSLDNLRRLLGGGRKKKEQPSFKRSDSFKRISIRKNCLDRGKGRRPPAPVVQEEPPPPADPLVIGYGQWIKCMRAEDYEHLKELGRALPPTPPPRRKYTPDSSLEVLKLESSPVVRRRLEERADSGLSVSLGRVWMDAPLAMANAPRSLELPRPCVEPSRVHHSLESGLKQPQVSRRTPTPISRKSVDVSSSKDSGFSFSVSIPRLSDLSPTGSGAFWKSSSSKVSVNQGSGRGRRKRSSGRKKSFGTARSDMYQVVVSRPPRSLKSLKLDPMIFVPPERRKTNTIRKGRYEVQEIRDYCNPHDLRCRTEDEGLYECISGDLNDGESEDRFETLSEEDEDEDYKRVVIRRPVRRKKSGKAKYIAKPTILRAPSTLRKNKKLIKKQGQFSFFLTFCF